MRRRGSAVLLEQRYLRSAISLHGGCGGVLDCRYTRGRDPEPEPGLSGDWFRAGTCIPISMLRIQGIEGIGSSYDKELDKVLLKHSTS